VEEIQMSTLYEKIIDVLQQKGPTSLSTIYNELNSFLGEEDTPKKLFNSL